MLRSTNSLMDCSCIAPLTPAVIVMRGFVFQPLFRIALISGSYLACFCVMACLGNQSWQYVNSMNCIVCMCEGNRGVGVWFGAPSVNPILCPHVNLISKIIKNLRIGVA